VKLGSDRPLVLASGSPRRQQLLRQAGYHFEVAPAPVPEPRIVPRQGLHPAGCAEASAYFKAAAVARDYPGRIVLGADTIVVHDGVVLGKAHNESDARHMLTRHFAGINEVITGLALIDTTRGRRLITHDRTRLKLRAMSEDEIEAYLAGGAWRGKAGAYALQEGGDRFVEEIEGSESNVVGLPLETLAEALAWLERT